MCKMPPTPYLHTMKSNICDQFFVSLKYHGVINCRSRINCVIIFFCTWGRMDDENIPGAPWFIVMCAALMIGGLHQNTFNMPFSVHIHRELYIKRDFFQDLLQYQWNVQSAFYDVRTQWISKKKLFLKLKIDVAKTPGSTNSIKQRKQMFNIFLEQNLPNTPRAPPHISTLYVHPLYLNHDLSNFVGSEINFDT